MADTRESTFSKLVVAASGLPEVTEGMSYGTPSLTVRKKFLSRVKDADTVVLMCPLEEKEMLMAAAPDIYFETAHYKGWPAILVRINNIDAAELRHRMRLGWLMQAPKGLAKTFLAADKD
jgi:hypothetical protein